MSEDVGVKAPVTRLRRRLSVETEDVKSPAGITTPTKKKGGRLATKPQLDLIKENDAEPVPKRSTRKAAAKDIVEPVDDKPMTPSRRSARIRSNTSIVSETTQSLDSPRAKRAAARRTSQAGSDNDGPVTPARQTRRTRKDSTSSIDKQGGQAVGNKTSATPEIIVEEQETNNDVMSVEDNSLSKTPKTRGKKGKKNSLSQSVDETENYLNKEEDKDLNTSKNKNKQVFNEDISESVVIITSSDDIKNKDLTKKNNTSENIKSNDIITEYLDEKPKQHNSVLHKSTSAIEDSKSFKSKRHRTKSGSTLGKVDAESNECNFFSDNEIYKKKKKDKSLRISNNKSNLSDNEILKNNSNISMTKLHKEDKENESQNTATDFDVKGEKINKVEIELETSSNEMETNEKSMTSNNESANHSFTKAGWKKNIINQIENMIDSSAKPESISAMKCFDKEPSKDVQPIIIMDEDSDSNAGNNGPVVQMDSEDQCVPVVKHTSHNDNIDMPNNKSYEPMDIDETITQNTSNIKSAKNSPKPMNQQLEIQTQLSLSMEQSHVLSSNKSKRKSSISSLEFHNLEKSSNENKSTLILSHIKDTSDSEIRDKSANADNKAQLSQSVNIQDKLKNKELERKKLSLDYSTSTPLQQKSMKKIGVPIDTSLISPKTTPKNKVNNISKKSIDKSDNSSMEKENEDSNEKIDMESSDNLNESDESGEEITKTQNEIIDDEAEEASENYQSGDSQDEDEKQYEEENEIVEKGETLDTDEEFSDDTDYEKDSFVVSSEEEDNELLSGSGDDLSLSDNELSMSAKSKKKYNERKIKEQKKASKEMYEARHKLDRSDKVVKKTKLKKNNRQRLDSSTSESEEEMAAQTKKLNRQRIDSSQELSDVKLDENESITKKKIRNRLSESVCSESALNEQEITVCNEGKMETEDPISVAIKREPKTPQKDNLSVVAINDDIEEVNIDSNATLIKTNETSDPLQASMQESDSDSESSGDHQEILNNYNSVLEDLNVKSKTAKKHDISLNINKKQKKAREPIVDQLNLTQTKPKKVKNKSVLDVDSLQKPNEKTDREIRGNEHDDDKGEESDSINMHLLFTEDSNDSVSNTEKNKSAEVGDASEAKDYISLKKAEAKTNPLDAMDEGGNDGCSFFIDTTGTRVDEDKSLDMSKISSKKKKMQNSLCETSILEVEEPADCSEIIVKKTPKKSLNITENQRTADNSMMADEIPDLSTSTSQSGKKKKKEKKSLAIAEENTTHTEEIDELENNGFSFFIDTVGARLDEDHQQNSSKKKKKRNSVSVGMVEGQESLEFDDDDSKVKKTPKKSLNTTAQQINEEINIADEIADVSSNTLGSTKKNKKGKKSLTMAAEENESGNIESEHNEPTLLIKTPQSAKKKNKSLLLDNSMNSSTVHVQEELSIAVGTPQSKKKKNKSLVLDQSVHSAMDQGQEEFAIPDKTPQSGKKKNKSLILDQSVNKSQIEVPNVKGTPQSGKKKNKSLMLDESQNEVGELAVEVKTPLSGKKKNKSLNLDQSTSKSMIEETEDQQEQSAILSSGKKKTKSKISLNVTQNESFQVENVTDISRENVQKSDKKRKSNVDTHIIPLEYNKSEEEGDAPLEISYKIDKKENNQQREIPGEDVTKESTLNTSSNSAKKKKQKSSFNSSTSEKEIEENHEHVNQNTEEVGSKKRKRTHSAIVQELSSLGNEEKYESVKLNESTVGSQKKKLKLTESIEDVIIQHKGSPKKDTNKTSSTETLGHKKIKKNKHEEKNVEIDVKETAKINQNKKRKRDDDIINNASKILKQDSMNNAPVTRLPSHILNQLGDRPNKINAEIKKTKVVATTEFKVEETRIKRNKPSNYLEESVYLNDDNVVEKNTKKYSIKKPKVLPFIPTASTSDHGFTTAFRIKSLPRETQFVAQATNIVNFKNDFLQQQKIKKFRTFEKYKTQRNVKLSKF